MKKLKISKKKEDKTQEINITEEITSNNTKPKKKGRIKNIIISVILFGAIGIVSLILVFALYIIITSPDFDKEKLYSKEATVLYYSDGVTELARFGRDNRVLVSYDELPEVLIDAIVATEDSRFFQHKGMDLGRFGVAFIGQLLNRGGAGGASTITMQLNKKSFTSDEARGIEGIVRKFTDIYMSIFKIERNYTKEEILEFYVNSMWFANDGNLNYTSIAGVEQACQYYFGKSVRDISLAEASIIAGMFQNPSLINPYRFPDRVRTRQKTVLKLMVDHGYISEDEKDAVLSIPIESLLAPRDNETSSANQAAIDYVLKQVQNNLGIDPYVTPVKIITTIDKDIQDVLNQLEDGTLFEFKDNVKDLQEGMAITSMADGSVKALSGGRGYQAKGTNHATDIVRQPGSSAKILFDYGPAIEYLNWSPATYILDEETTYSNGTVIRNADRKYNGLISMRTALSGSRNIPALKTFKAVAAEDKSLIENFVHSLGINYGGDLYEAASIGGFEGVNPLQMSAAYAAFGRSGYYIAPYAYTKVTDITSGEIFEYKPERVKVMSEETAYLITSILLTANDKGVGGIKVSGTDIAAKTGTTNVDSKTMSDLGLKGDITRDAWNITYSPEYSIALWLGYDRITSDNYLTSTIGNTNRKGIMNAVGSKVYSKNKSFSKPSSVISVEIEKDTIPLQLASEFTPADMRITELFKEGTEPTEVSTRYAKLATPTGGSYSFDGTQLKLSWTGISTPNDYSTSYLQDYFNTYYEDFATKYYEERVKYNNTNIGSLGYSIYRDDNGTLTYLSRTENNSFTIANPPTGTYTYVIKAEFSIFKANASSGLEIRTNTGADSNITEIIQDEPEPSGGNELD